MVPKLEETGVGFQRLRIRGQQTSGYCPRCNSFTKFTYIGMQELFGGEEIHEYNCENPNCKSTLGEQTILRANIK